MASLDTAGKDPSSQRESPVHPRPQLARKEWRSLDGRWSFRRGDAAGAIRWPDTIEVPFAPEAPLSGVADPGFHPVVWYRREFDVPDDWRGRRIVLHFGAVDHDAAVWVNGDLVARHEGGYTPFAADITDALRDGVQEVVVRAEDDPADMAKPRGKQDWLPEPHAIWYPRTTGIWQTVWIEPVPDVRIERLRYTPDLAGFSIGVQVDVAADADDADDLALEVKARLGGETLVHDAWRVAGGSARRTIHLGDPGIDDARRAYLWSPEHPRLIDVELVLKRGGEIVDRVDSYTALREVAVRDGAFHLNGRPYFLRLALDQGYWPDGHMTPPTPGALRDDVELAKALGFNGVRKHQKIEDPRFLYWTDRLGLLVWEELPSAYTFAPRGLDRLTRLMLEVIERDANHPSVVAWVAFNESWGVPDLPASDAQRHAVRALYSLARALDPTRPVVGNDGWEHVASDLFTIHDYDGDPDALRERYASCARVEALLEGFFPHGRSLDLAGDGIGARPVILSEFGGVRLGDGGDGWGYSHAASSDDFLARYRALVAAASGAGLAGFCYTQLTDTFQEQNGLVTMHREPKAPIEALARATRGASPEGG